MVIRSIRWRLLAWFAFVLMLALTGLAVVAYQLHQNNRFAQIDEELERRMALISSDLRRPPFKDRGGGRPFGPEDFPPPHGRGFEDGRGFPHEPPGPPPRMRDFPLSDQTQALFGESDSKGHFFRVWSRDGRLLKPSSNVVDQIPMPERREKDTRTRIRTRDRVRESYHFTELGDCVLVGRRIDQDLAESRRFLGLLVFSAATVLALGVGGGWALATRALRPVEAISAAAERISEGNLSERVSVTDGSDELGALAGVLNRTFARLEDAFAQQRRFTADASHELRTPLAVLISETQSTLARPRTADEYRETVEACLETAQQMRRLADSLLELARFDAGQEPFERKEVDLASLLQSCAQAMRPLAAAREVSITVETAPSVVMGDSDRLGQVVTNLLANAMYYNRPGGTVRAECTVQSGRAVLRVLDTGVGIPTEDLPRIFERFYRADKSRGRSEGRSGLGLAIVKAIVDAHGAEIVVESRVGEGSVFKIMFPSAADAENIQSSPV